MDATMIADLIANLGFPTVIILALGWFIYKLWQQSATREDKLMEEITENRLVNEKAIETIAQYAERLTHIEGSIERIESDVIQIKDKIQ